MTPILSEKRSLFRPVKPRDSLYRVLALTLLILAGVWLLRQVGEGAVKPVLLPTPTPTRTVGSYIQQAQAYFEAGKLDDPTSSNDAIDTYLAALAVEPDNAQVLAELARIEAYSSIVLSSDAARLARLEQAKAHIERAVALAPDDSTVYAVYAFVLDWYASSNLLTADERQRALNEAETAAVRALQLDPNNTLALAFYAEVLADQQNWDQAEQYAEQAIARAPNSMDAHRVYATVLETMGRYRDSISEFNRAAELAPNLTFLYLRIGYGYRNLGSRAATKDAAKVLYDTALTYFDRAASINTQLGLRDPQPYLAIAKTYAQQGEFFSASLNAEKALSFDPTNADTYGQLGMIYVQARNYESALPALQCAVEGCTAEENETAQQLVQQGLLEQSVAVRPLELTNLTVAYYYVRYGSVLAYLSQPGDGKCERVYALMDQLRQAFPDDPLLLGNVEANEATCQLLSGSPQP